MARKDGNEHDTHGSSATRPVEGLAKTPRPRRPTPAMAVSVVALCLTMGGSAVAASSLITSKQIKDGTIQKGTSARRHVTR